jgi:hypothetical protein
VEGIGRAALDLGDTARVHLRASLGHLPAARGTRSRPRHHRPHRPQPRAAAWIMSGDSSSEPLVTLSRHRLLRSERAARFAADEDALHKTT